jgi:ectoine hydroxylase-related dioxygenase (phytanoyl-CoA dioxygenase family)
MSIDHFHSDGDAFFPLPDSIKRHDPRVRMPVMWIGVQMALTDIEAIEDGPTQYVPGSHYSGRSLNRNNPSDDPENPEFDGKGPVSVFCKAGDIYLHDPMCWHRGAPNTTDRRRYLLQSQYASSQAYRIGHAFNQYTPEPVNNDMLRTGSDQFLNLLGRPRPDGA